MILRSLASNQPYTLLIAPVTVLAALLPAAWGQNLPLLDAGFPADQIFAGVYQHREWVTGLAITLIIAGALLSNVIFNRHEFYNVPVYVPSVVYAMLATCMSFIQLSLPLLAANLFVLVGLNKHLRIFRQSKILGESFESGFWYGLAAVFYPPFIVLAAGLWISLLITRAFHWREHLLPVLAFAVPFIYWIAWKYWKGEADDIVLFRKILTYDARVFFLALPWVQRMYFIACLVLLGAALPRYLFLNERSSNKARSVKISFLVMAAAMALAFLAGYLLILKWILPALLLPITFVVGYWFTNYRYSLLAPFAFYGICLFSLLMTLSFYQVIPL